MKQEILSQLSPQYPWGELLHCFNCLDSTNDHLKALARSGSPEGTAVLAAMQTNGHGRLGRSFQSPRDSGVYLSLLLRPECRPTDLMHLTCAVAVAMCSAVETAAGFRPQIKWTNDLVWNRRKLGGILTELAFTPQGQVDYAILGIGLNCTQQPEDFPPELQDMAASLSMAAGRPISREALTAAMLESLHAINSILLTEKPAILSQYRRDCMTLGQDISILQGDRIRHGKALDIDPDGGLLVEFPDGYREVITSGEASVRGMYHYV